MSSIDLFKGHPVGRCPTCRRKMRLPCFWCRVEAIRKARDKGPRVGDLCLKAFEGKLDLGTIEIGISLRAVNILEGEGIFTLRDVLRAGPEYLMSCANLGPKLVGQICEKVEQVRDTPPLPPEDEHEKIQLELKSEDEERRKELLRRKELQRQEKLRQQGELRRQKERRQRDLIRGIV